MSVDLELGPSAEGVIKKTRRITPEDTVEVREIQLNIADPTFRYVEGQSIGVAVPGPHDFGNKYHVRRYTIAGLRDQALDGVDLELVVRRCAYVDDYSGEKYPGVASNFLCDAKPGDKITILGPYPAPFRIPADDTANLLMIGTGTGIAPFRAFIKHIYDERGGWKGDVRLFYGAETGLDLYYMNDVDDDLTNYLTKETFEVIKAVAGRPMMSAEQGLEHGLHENAADVWELLQKPNTHVFLSGLARVTTAFDKVMAKTSGSETTWEEVKQKLKSEGRWSELLYP